VVYVLCPEDVSTIIGYYTLSTASIETTQLPEDISSRLPRYEALPTFLIGRLAVDQNYHGQGFGSHLLSDALKRCLRSSEDIGAIAVLVDAKDEGAAKFYEHYGFRRFVNAPLRLFMPMAEIAKLS
jgi:GNAT superfamily N-acetyltransferase